MVTLIYRLVLGVLVTLPCLVPVPQASAQSASEIVDSLSWMAGCWMNETPNRIVEENWMRPAGASMMAVNRSVSNGRTVAYEFIQIREVAPDTLAFIAMPSGQKGAAFRLKRTDYHEVVFENPTHDFPQRISYRLVAADSLVGRIEGNVNGAERGVDFPFKRVECRGG